ncbi:MAG: PSP1 domain-containing protein, partial [Planctomycetota bacterium]
AGETVAQVAPESSDPPTPPGPGPTAPQTGEESDNESPGEPRPPRETTGPSVEEETSQAGETVAQVVPESSGDDTPPAPGSSGEGPSPSEGTASSVTPEAPPPPPRKMVRVRYGMALERGVLHAHLDDLDVGETCIVKTRRGIEWGEITEVFTDTGGEPTEGRVLRRPKPADRERIREIHDEGTDEEFRFCREKIAEHDLPMNLVAVEKIFSGDKIIFYFTANGRVDFRALVKTLAQAYRKRIELKQIGVRDEAKLLGSVGHCGRELCCRSFMRNIEQVTMKMAKVQKSTLDPTKISGRCGRLMCCLRFEDKAYREMKAELPNRGEMIWTEKGQVQVIDQRILGQKLLVRGPQGDRFVVPLSDVLDGPPPPKPPPPKPPPPRRRPPREGPKREKPLPPRQGAPAAKGEDRSGKGQGSGSPGQGQRRGRGRGRRRPQRDGPQRPRSGAKQDPQGTSSGKPQGQGGGQGRGPRRGGGGGQGRSRDGDKRGPGDGGRRGPGPGGKDRPGGEGGRGGQRGPRKGPGGSPGGSTGGGRGGNTGGGRGGGRRRRPPRPHGSGP